MSKPRELYMKAINGQVTFHDEKPKGNCIIWVEKSAADKLAEVLEAQDCKCGGEPYWICDRCYTLREYRGEEE